MNSVGGRICHGARGTRPQTGACDDWRAWRRRSSSRDTNLAEATSAGSVKGVNATHCPMPSQAISLCVSDAVGAADLGSHGGAGPAAGVQGGSGYGIAGDVAISTMATTSISPPSDTNPRRIR